MRKYKKYLIFTLVAAFLAVLTFSQAGRASARQEPPVGVVVAYVPGQVIVIADKNGVRHEYMLSSTLEIMPRGRANSLAVGSFVTIIAPASLSQGKQTAVGIVVHPHVPNGWTVPSQSETPTPAASATPVGTSTEPPTGTVPVTESLTPSDTPPVPETATPTETQGVIEPSTPTALGVGTPSGTPTPAPTPASGGAVTTNTLIEWLRSLLRQLVPSQ